nr:hypothetical protein CFP56_04492 [Quercus suber]
MLGYDVGSFASPAIWTYYEVDLLEQSAVLCISTHTTQLLLRHFGSRIMARFEESIAKHPERLELFQRGAKTMYGPVVEIKGLNGWNERQIADLAYAANAAVTIVHHKPFNPAKGQRPTVATTLVVGDTACISKSVKGGAYLYHPPEPGPDLLFRYWELNRADQYERPSTALRTCQSMEVGRPGHRTGASCGEVMAILALFRRGHVEGLTDARIVSIIGESITAHIVEPCGCPTGKQVSRSQAVTAVVEKLRLIDR